MSGLAHASGPRAGDGAAGWLVCVVGPSGAGKDTVIAAARAELAGDPAFLFPRRLVTRARSPWEDHESLSEEAFAAGVSRGAFALHWRAHGLGYALPRTLIDEVRGGRVAVCNLSRTRIAAAREHFGRVGVVLVTAPPEVIAARLAARGRESAETIAGRLGRADAVGGDVAPDLVIRNTGTVAAGGQHLVAYLKELAAAAAPPPE
ncbi:phosphonate metabolism protein/1,5-bisphosphokinase (PRPP-forming) PhnN [Chelatococcus sp. SYSU_G07232]|uniref:Ribose 1,5-bisphosphate phosphokinase PhnN n=1 Tax=Chelatococcus albus TaxID=3047466 RepID=A0ABT7AJV1_9HYPH|nr:phosphonate metabolism protein/1,5-bisphosphokinase (PRPP-forming) PhnN [Chelatococcus sp. SYSU_G07232]MDJ1159099.1 phosphonate metabolism protein/1,5-bisphosphokinase (PRPP-forming) PhnN [Chelatococcus sp. SYSU_G07232]